MSLALERLLNSKKETDSFRQLKIVHGLIDFSSNDYLGLANSKELFEVIQQELEKIKPPYNGSTGSRLLSGNSELSEELEAKLGKIFHFLIQGTLPTSQYYHHCLNEATR